jgi:hypothetical protein
MNLALVLAFLAVVMAVFIADSTSGGGAGVGGYLVVAITGAVVIPVVAYPVSLTLWCAVDYLMRGRLGGEHL